MNLRARIALAAATLISLAFPEAARAAEPRLGNPTLDEQRDLRERAALLNVHVGDELARDQPLSPLPGVVLAWAGTAGSALLIPADKGAGITWTSTFAITAIANTAAAFGDEDTQLEDAEATAALPAGGLTLGLALTDHQTIMPRLAAGGAGAGLLGFSALSALNMLLWHHVPIARLRADRARLRTPAQRAALSHSQVAQIERDLMTFERPIPSWALALPLLIGGSVALVPAFERGSTARDRAWSIGYGSIALLLGAGFGIGGAYSAAHSYVSDLHRSGLQLIPLASRDSLGVSVSGQF
jgi:hypothetical protein